ncbi:MAG: universal stress protein [Chlorobi bacterium]|nr:universal stress protein [Chlorobiota bacterium]
MKKFLLPVDFSEGSIVNCKYAFHLAGSEKTELYLFHIYPDQLMVPDSSFPAGIDSDTFLNAEFINEMREQAEKNLIQLAEQVKDLLKKEGITNIRVKHQVTGGDPEWEIKDICERIKPNLIIMGTRGEGKKGFLEGSMAGKIMSKAPVPVIAVPELIKKVKLKNIMYATNFSKSDFQQINYLVKLLKPLKNEFFIVHFLLNDKKERSKSAMDELKIALINKNPDEKFHFFILETDSKQEVLKEFTSKHSIHMIAFIAHKTNIFKNLFRNEIRKKDFFKLELPMLALHED